MMTKYDRSTALPIAAVLLLAAAWKTVFLIWDVVPFNSDEAVVALMARHILNGARPTFFYGQAYMGSLDAFLIAAGFRLLGQQVWVIRLVQLILYLGTVWVTILIGREAFGSLRVGLLAGLLLAVPTVNVTLYTTATLGGYGEAMLLGSGTLLLSLVIARRHIFTGAGQAGLRAPWLWFGLWGLLAGCGLWANGLSLVFSVPAGLYLLWAIAARRRDWLLPFVMVAGVGLLVGSLPWWLYAIQHGPAQLVQELFGTAVSVEKDPWLLRTGKHLVNFLLLGTTALFGLRPPWSVDWLVLPVLPFVLFFWAACLVFFARHSFRPGPDRHAYALLGGVCAALLGGFLFTAFGVDPSGRYFLPMAVPLALTAAQFMLCMARRGWHVAALAALVVGYQAAGTVQCALRFPPGLTTQFYEPTIIDHRADQALIDFLRKEGETTGYTNYWVTYPLAFHSQEELVFIPRLPYHLDLRYTPRDDRYAPYTARVAASRRVAYITTRNPALDDYLRAHFSGLGVDWQEQQIGDYHVYYHLSRAVHPGEIGLGDARE